VARGVAQQSGARHKFCFKNKLFSIDASTIELCASVFGWAKFRRRKGTVKLHLILDHDGLLPSYAVITGGKQHEAAITRQWEFAPGTILVATARSLGATLVTADGALLEFSEKGYFKTLDARI
jgi:hypothetical protein